MIKKYHLIILLFLIASCKDGVDKGTTIIDGTIHGAEGEIIRFEELKPFGIFEIDSALIDKTGRFQFNANPTRQSFYLLRYGNTDPISIVMDKGDSIEVRMELDADKLSYQVKGNTDSRLLQKFYSKNSFYYSKIDSLRQVFFESRDLDTFYLVNERIGQAIEKVISDQRNYTEKLIRKNPASLASILLINQLFAGKAIFNPEQNLDLFLLVDEKLNGKFPDNPHVIENHKRVAAAQQKEADRRNAEAQIAVGKPVPQILLPGFDGNPEALADLNGTNVILFFWASWSPESRADMQQLKELYSEVKSRNFEIYAVSLDHNEKFWKSAVQIEKTGWIDVNDINGVDGPVSNLFRIPKQLPYFFLIDKKGIIVTKTSDFSELKDACLGLTDAG